MNLREEIDLSLIDPSFQVFANEFSTDITFSIDVQERDIMIDLTESEPKSLQPFQIPIVVVPEEDKNISESSASSRQKRDNRKIITPDFHLFFLPLKMKNTKNTYIFLYNYPFIGIYNVDSINPEIEVFPRSTKVAVEGRILIVNPKSAEQRYQIKLDKEKVDSILNCDEKSSLACYIKCHRFVPELEPTFILNNFYVPYIYNTHFLNAVANLQITEESFTDMWVNAGGYIFEPMLTYLCEKEYKTYSNPEKCFKKSSFVVQIGAAILRNDQEFTEFIGLLSGGKKFSNDKYLKLLAKYPFSEYSQLMIHILYKTAMTVYRRPAQAYYLIGSFIFKAGLTPLLKHSCKEDSELARLHEFNHAGVPLDELALFERILSKFQNYPVDINLPSFSDSNFQAFVAMEKMTDLNNPKFIEAVRKTEPIPAENLYNPAKDGMVK